MTFIDTRTSGISSYSRDVTSSTYRTSDIKSGIIKLNNRSIRIDAGDTLQAIVRKINRCSSFTGVRASVATESGRQIIALSSSGQITIVDSNNILNNIGVRIRSNQLQSRQLLFGLVLTELAATKSSSNRYGNYGHPEPRAIEEVKLKKSDELGGVEALDKPSKSKVAKPSDFTTINLRDFFKEEEMPDDDPIIKPQLLIDPDQQRKDSIAIGEKYKKSIQPPDKATKLLLKQMDKGIKQMLRTGKLKENDSIKVNNDSKSPLKGKGAQLAHFNYIKSHIKSYSIAGYDDNLGYIRLDQEYRKIFNKLPYISETHLMRNLKKAKKDRVISRQDSYTLEMFQLYFKSRDQQGKEYYSTSSLVKENEKESKAIDYIKSFKLTKDIKIKTSWQ